VEEIKNKRVLIGEIINNVKVLELFGKNKQGAKIWKCKTLCCGKMVYFDSGRLRTKLYKCCLPKNTYRNYLLGNKSPLWKGYEEISANKWGEILNNAKKRNLNVNVTIQDIWYLFIKQDRKCALSGLDLNFGKNQTASLDRIDSSKGYEIDNVWWVHKDINKMKMHYPLDIFIEMCYLVTNPLNIYYTNQNLITHKFWSSLKYGAKSRSIDISISKSEVINILYKQNFRCAMTGLYIDLQRGENNKTASIDRIDCKKPYNIKNIQWVHKYINVSRKELSIEYYNNLCNKIINHFGIDLIDINNFKLDTYSSHLINKKEEKLVELAIENYVLENKIYKPVITIDHKEGDFYVSATFEEGNLVNYSKFKNPRTTLKVKRLTESAKLPTRAHDTDAGADIFADADVVIRPGETVKIPTGFAMEIPEGYYGQLNDRSSVGAKGLKIMGGVCDSAYRGEILVCLCNTANGPETESYQISKGDKIAQMVLLQHESWPIEEVDELSDSDRGHKGFGSSGK
jgi:deoxyuridine 5'-triphosphate nucleotidohydrolase